MPDIRPKPHAESDSCDALSCPQAGALQPLRGCCNLLVPLLRASPQLREFWAAPCAPGDEDWECCWAGVAALVREVSFRFDMQFMRVAASWLAHAAAGKSTAN